jgi:hypothetical protein
MIAARNDRTIRDVGQSVAIRDKHFEVVKEFVYLGSLITPTNDVRLEKQRRIQTANRCFFGLRKHLQYFRVRRGCWPKGRRTNCSYLRGTIENGVCRKRSNHELDKEFNSPNALNLTKTSRLRYARHMIRRPEDLPQKALFRVKLIGRRNQGRPKSR